MTLARCAAALLAVLTAVAPARADKPASPRGQAHLQALGKPAEGGGWKGGSWVEVDYGRPLLRGRSNIFGAGAEAGTLVNGGAPVWRLGANEATRLKTEVPLNLGGKKIAPGEYALFAEVKDGAWTLIVSSQPTQAVGEGKAKGKIWGSYGYDPKFDVARVPLLLSKSDSSVEEFTIGFADVNPLGAKLQIAWERTVATALIAFEK